MNKYSLGIDVGSTTVKTVITDDKKTILYSKYQRHFSKIKELRPVIIAAFLPNFFVHSVIANK